MKLHFLVFKCIHYRFDNQLLSVRKQNYVDMQMDDLPEINFESSLRASSTYTAKNKQSQESKIQQNEILQSIDIDDEKQDSELEEVGILVESVDTLRVTEADSLPVKTQTKKLLENFIQDLTEYDTTLLKQYLDILHNNNQTVIKDVSNNIVSSIEQVLRQQSVGHYEWPENVLMVILSWLVVSILCLADPHVKPPYRVFSELLTQTTMKERVRLATACWRHLSPDQLIELADVAIGPGGRMDTEIRDEQHLAIDEVEGQDTSLTDLLLRATLGRLQTTSAEPQWFLGRLEGEEVTELVSAAWPTAGGGARSLLTRVAMRAHAAGRLHAPPAVLKAASRATSASSQPETIKVLVDVSKLVLLFIGDDEEDKILAEKPKKRGRPRANISN
ncbi:uncharacterized protein LOC133319476 isoform X2 [Danaus plexippus]|uniref:uncharacterized protein LOC133319476 isoform X2 n=1 Tax=Danaus plexippus TaxID=13037 RepID=UPI002AB2C5E7|nr:uncharacterized protein LOC133319476 isoform X2 [Danaus plexippus]